MTDGNREGTGRRPKICYPTVWGDGKIDRRRSYVQHDLIPQPFYGQDWRWWCRRCCLLGDYEQLAAS